MADGQTVDLGIAGLGSATRIGSGGFADVYRAEQTHLRREVAVKILRAPASDTQARMRFERECQALGAVSGHPNIVGLHGGGFTDDGRAYLIMELCRGGSLLDRIRRSGSMPVADVVDVGTKIGRALGVAHDAGVLHRDVKPANILVTAFGEPALADFGIARVEGGQQTATGMVTASVAHAAPEVLEGGQPSTASDIYSLGSTMFELFVGRAPHSRPGDESVWALMNRVLSEPIPDPASAGMPEPLASVIRRATQRRLGDRYSSAADLVADLGTSASTAAVAGPPPAHKQPLHPTVPADPAPADQEPPHPSSLAGSPPAHQQPPHPTALADSVAARQRPPHPSSVPVVAVAGDAPTEAMRAVERSPVTGYPHDGRVMPQIAVGRPGPEHQHRKRRRRGPVLFGLAFVAAVAAGGAGLWFYAGLGDDADPELAFPEGSSGPLDEGVSYDLAVAGDHEDATYRLVVDGQAVGSPEPTIKPFVPEAGRHSVAVEVTMGSSVDVTEPVEVYVIGQLPGESYRANLESVMADPVNWSAAIRAFDQLVAAGHDDLLLLPSERFVSLTTGYWSLLVAGFEDREAARGYCERFGREIPNECFTARFTPSA